MDWKTILFFIGAVVATVLLALFAAKAKNMPKKKRRKRMRIILYIYILTLLAIPISGLLTYGNWTEAMAAGEIFYSNPLFFVTIIIVLISFANTYFRKGDADEDEEE